MYFFQLVNLIRLVFFGVWILVQRSNGLIGVKGRVYSRVLRVETLGEYFRQRVFEFTGQNFGSNLNFCKFE